MEIYMRMFVGSLILVVFMFYIFGLRACYPKLGRKFTIWPYRMTLKCHIPVWRWLWWNWYFKKDFD
jgi:hypothetical protein